jgi:hypothetical protein
VALVYSWIVTCSDVQRSPVPWYEPRPSAVEHDEEGNAWRPAASIVPSLRRSRSAVAMSPGFFVVRLKKAAQVLAFVSVLVMFVGVVPAE